MRNFTRGALTSQVIALATSLSFTTVPAADLGDQPIPGSWSSVPSQDGAVAIAARFALQEQSRQSHSPVTLLAIKHVRQQVVAGTNFSMNLMVMAEGKKHLVIAVVWTKPDGSMELTRWHWV